MSDIITVRDIDTVTTEIKIIRQQAQQIMLQAAIEIGRRLAEAKEMIPHGEWGKWLAESVDYSQSTADNLLRIYKEYGSQQESLFGNFANSESFAKLSYTQALALLAVPADERAEFAEENNVAEMSTRELQQAIRERDAAREELQGALQRTEDYGRLTKENGELRQKANQMEAAARSAQNDAKRIREQTIVLEKDLEKAKEAQSSADAKLQKLQEDLKKAKEDAKTAKGQLAEAKAHPEIPETIMEQMRAEVAEQAAKDAVADMQKKVDEAQHAAAKAEKARLEAEEAVATAQKQAKLQSPEVAVFGSMFDDLQAAIHKINDYRLKTGQTNPEAAAGMLRALTALYSKAAADLEQG